MFLLYLQKTKKMVEKIAKAIGQDLTEKMNKKKISDYYIHSNLLICTAPTLTKIKKGKYYKSYPLDVLINIYKAIGEQNINIKDNSFTVYINF